MGKGEGQREAGDRSSYTEERGADGMGREREGGEGPPFKKEHSECAVSSCS